MIYNFTGVQHLKSGDITIPVIAFEDEEACEAKFHHEMEYAITNKEFNGLTIIIFDNTGKIVVHENWIRKIPDPVPEIVQEEDQTEIPEIEDSENEEEILDPEEAETEEPEIEEPEIEEPESDE